MMACLMHDGTDPDDRDRLMILQMAGMSGSKHCFKSVVGMGSSWHVELFDDLIISLISFSVAGVKLIRFSVSVLVKLVETILKLCWSICWRIFTILDTK